MVPTSKVLMACKKREDRSRFPRVFHWMLYIRVELTTARQFRGSKLMEMTITRPRFLAPCLAAALLLGASAQAQARADGSIFLCVDGNGKRELTDTMKPGCRLLAVPGSIPAPAPRKSSAAVGGSSRTNAPAPADFPKVDTSTQRVRDNERREILNEELRAEERRLAELRREFNNGEPERQGNERNFAKYQERVEQMRANIKRGEANLEALNREIANIK
jgi:hypothetical protein